MNTIEEKNKISQSTAWLTFVKITFPASPDNVVYLVQNTEDITWDGETWQAYGLDCSEITETYLGELTSGDIFISNVDRMIEAYLQAYDTYIKANGYYPITINIYTVNSGNTASATPEREYEFEVTRYLSNELLAVFTVGAPNLFDRRSPTDRLLKNQCQVVIFADVTCGYSGAETECDRTLTRCRELGNSGRYGGFPGVGDAAKRWQI